MLRRNRRAGKTGGKPGFTPIDDITAEDRVVDLDPSGETGRSPSQMESSERGKKRRRWSQKSSGRHKS